MSFAEIFVLQDNFVLLSTLQALQTVTNEPEIAVNLLVFVNTLRLNATQFCLNFFKLGLELRLEVLDILLKELKDI